MRRTIGFFLGGLVLMTAAGAVPNSPVPYKCEKEFQAWQKAKAEVETAERNRDLAEKGLALRAKAKDDAKSYVSEMRQKLYDAEDAYVAAREKYAECVVEHRNDPEVGQNLACGFEKADMDKAGVNYNNALQAYEDAKNQWARALDDWADAMANLRQKETELFSANLHCTWAYNAYQACMKRFS